MMVVVMMVRQGRAVSFLFTFEFIRNNLKTCPPFPPSLPPSLLGIIKITCEALAVQRCFLFLGSVK